MYVRRKLGRLSYPCTKEKAATPHANPPTAADRTLNATKTARIVSLTQPDSFSEQVIVESVISLCLCRDKSSTKHLPCVPIPDALLHLRPSRIPRVLQFATFQKAWQRFTRALVLLLAPNLVTTILSIFA